MLLLALLPLDAVACDYSFWTPDHYRDALRTLDAVFTGRVVEAETSWDSALLGEGGTPYAVFAVERRWTGPNADTVRIEAFTTCNAVFEEGATYVVYADSADGAALTAFIGWYEHAPDREVATQVAKLDSTYADMVESGWDPTVPYRPRFFDHEAFVDSLIADARSRGATGGFTGGVYDDATNELLDLSDAVVTVLADGERFEGGTVTLNEPRWSRETVGHYSVVGLPPGRYTLRILVPGYRPEERHGYVAEGQMGWPFRLRR